ncbi:hypothetical protein ACSSS7_006270 [Eimeria intestinalis]
MVACSSLVRRVAAGGAFLWTMLILKEASPGFCQVSQLPETTHLADTHAEGQAKKTESEGHPLPHSQEHAKESPTAHPWEATCAAYRSLTVAYPDENLQAIYDLRPLAEEAPRAGWACKASEPLFEMKEYPPFFRAVLSILAGRDEEEEGKPKLNELHRHQDKHVFFTFNPCRLLPHTCQGSRGRLFKFAAKLKKPHEADDEIRSLMARWVQQQKQPSEAANAGDEEADTTECLQNVLPTNTTLLYSHRHESSQQHPNSNGLGGLWGEPEVSDDPTPWEPLDPKNPHHGLQSRFRHMHLFCPEASLITHITLKCPGESGGTGATSFDSCEHVTPCLFRMVLTSKAACPIAVMQQSAKPKPPVVPHAEMAKSGSHQPSATVTETKGEKQEGESEKTRHPLNPHSFRLPSIAGSHGALQHPAASLPQRHLPLAFQQDPGVAAPASLESVSSYWWLPSFSSLLSLGLRVTLCFFVFAWMIYAIRDWTQTKMQYSPLPEGKPAEKATAPPAHVNTYDSCVEALVEVPLDTKGNASTAPACEMVETHATNRSENSRGAAAAHQMPRRELRGLFSSPGRRFVSVWLPQTLDAAAHSAHAWAVAAHSLCTQAVSAVTTGMRRSNTFHSRHMGSDGSRWDWTEAIGALDEDDAPPASPTPAGLLGRCGYETL